LSFYYFQFDPSKDVAVFARISYDAYNERLSIVEEIDEKKEKKFYEYILLHRERTMYQIELSINKTGKCVKKDLDEPFHRFEIPSNATFYGEATIGSNALPGLGVNVALFGGEMGDDRYYVTVTEPGCVPVHENVVSKKYGFIHTSFFDVELGVDPERFVPPSECEE
ncbi:mammalian ependymin-related protein 1-like, partial [Orbicella faveolata]|uniref:mammalian ependymin-related protein 1-like n=1 Tax=Orbicella faveolata TaxID=48498 RepID=UPI0009E4BBEB